MSTCTRTLLATGMTTRRTQPTAAAHAPAHTARADGTTTCDGPASVSAATFSPAGNFFSAEVSRGAALSALRFSLASPLATTHAPGKLGGGGGGGGHGDDHGGGNGGDGGGGNLDDADVRVGGRGGGDGGGGSLGGCGSGGISVKISCLSCVQAVTEGVESSSRASRRRARPFASSRFVPLPEAPSVMSCSLMSRRYLSLIFMQICARESEEKGHALQPLAGPRTVACCAIGGNSNDSGSTPMRPSDAIIRRGAEDRRSDYIRDRSGL